MPNLISRKRRLATASQDCTTQTHSGMAQRTNIGSPTGDSTSVFRRTSLRVLKVFGFSKGTTANIYTPPSSPPTESGHGNHIRRGSPNIASQVQADVDLQQPTHMPGVFTPPASPVSQHRPTTLDGMAKSQPDSFPSLDPDQGALDESISTSKSPDVEMSEPQAAIVLKGDTFPPVFSRSATPTSSYSLWMSSQSDMGSKIPSQPSTAKTTPNSSGSGSSVGTVVRRINNHPASQSASTNGSSTMERIDEHLIGSWKWVEHSCPNRNPSIISVEGTSAAQVFIESHYEHLFQESPRSKRRQLLETSLRKSHMASEEQNLALQEWLKSESHHMRQLRVTKSKTLVPRCNTRTSMADFEIIRVLGKGSFGVVRLVCKREASSAPTTATDSGLSVDGNTHESADASSSGSLAGAQAAMYNKKVPRLRRPVFAMKTIRKSAMLRGAQEGHLRAERDFLVLAENSGWVVPLVAAFQDNTNLYLVMEYMIGGDFLGLLLREDIIGEGAAAFYLAEMILCVEESHRMGWIHRDVKPDNFLIDAKGHLKISDFGLSFDGHWSHNQAYYSRKRYDAARILNLTIRGDVQDMNEELTALETHKVVHDSTTGEGSPSYPKDEALLDYLNRASRRKFATSVVGTSQYMAPEVIRGEQYDGRCDWWSIGIILYECLYGRTPFYCETRYNTKEKILRHAKYLHFPEMDRMNQPWEGGHNIPLPPVTNLAIDLMSRLIVEKQYRISCSRYKSNDSSSSAQQSRRSFSAGVLHRSTSNAAMFQGIGGRVNSGLRSRSSSMSNGTSFVYPDDARDIKSHPFFQRWGIDFHTIHLQTPPYPPKIRNDDPITKYFDDEKDIVSDGEAGLDDSSDDDENLTANNRARAPDAEHGNDGEVMTTADEGITNRIGTGKLPDYPTMPRRKQQDKKRARDKILRDPNMGKAAMALRKRKAFLGYTYRRPDVWLPNADSKDTHPRGKRRQSRPTIFTLGTEATASQ